MKKLLPLFIVLSLVISCGKSHNGTMLVNGNIDGFKKGTIYLQKYVDTLLVSVDSIQLNGESNFTLADDVLSPEIYYLTINEVPNENILFFGEKGEITITSKLPKLEYSAKITGSKNQDLLDEYQEMASQFNNKQLDYIKEKFEAQKNNNKELLEETEASEQQLLKRKYLYTANFALTHKDAEVAPYIALTELYYANIKLLDTVNNSLSKNVKASKYGVQLDEFIGKIKKAE
ncbi:DUF4369 domain-containing protein [Lutibacter holmesii]|uniref:DUF4369 domain-containing protein n=1 Tax=Lutibacter holmesii TaxID=1137985 RepID=A0ABW3WMM3_9FLAO